MTPAWLQALRWIGIVAAAVGGSGAGLLGWYTPQTSERVAKLVARHDAALAFLRLPALGRALVVLQLAASIAAALLTRVTGSCAWLGISVAAWTLPGLWLSRRRDLRVLALEAQLDGWLVSLANALRATPSLGEALAATVWTTQSPLAQELDHLLKEHQLGVPLDRALDAAAQRIGSRSFTALLLTLQVARASGGGVSECLERAAATLREMLRLDGVLRTKTAEGKAQASVVGVLPFPFFALLDALDPAMLQPMLTTDAGHVLLACALLIWAVAVALAWRIVQVDL